MGLEFYNQLSRKKEIFKPLKKMWVGLYTCGPTVYNFAHIGNLRTYIFEDILRRALEYGGYKVRHVMNITDVEDKIIRDAARAGKTIFEFVKPYEQAFFEDLQKLNIKKAWKYPKATEEIAAMVALIRALLKKGIAYEADGSIYFDISKFKTYGKLSRVKARELKAGVRIDSDEYAKGEAEDFVLWKGRKEGEPSWEAYFDGVRPARREAASQVRPLWGRPGWHIECSAMSMKYLGGTFDIHGGGVDLIFPHHENEIAQSQAATGKPFARFFVEGEHLLVDGQKMSKSLGNVFTLRDIEAKGFDPALVKARAGFDPLVFRYLCLTAHYRTKLNFTWESLAASKNSLDKLREFAVNLKAGRLIPSPFNRRGRARVGDYEKRFEDALNDDLNTPKALAVVWDIIKQYNKNPSAFDPKEVLKFLYDADRVLGLRLKEAKREEIPVAILRLSEEREEYRKKKDWEKADEVRSKIAGAGYTVEDTAEGARVKKI